MNVPSQIQKLYDILEAESPSLHYRADILFSLIQLKSKHMDCIGDNRTIYLDIKEFIKVYVESRESRDLGYDILDLKKVISAIISTNSHTERFQLATYAHRLLSNFGFEEEAKAAHCFLLKQKTANIRNSKWRLGKYLRYVLHLTSLSFGSICFTLALLLTFASTILLPAPAESMVLFDVEYTKYLDVPLADHLMNIVLYCLDLSDGLSVVPKSLGGILILIIFKGFYILFIINYLYTKIIESINKN